LEDADPTDMCKRRSKEGMEKSDFRMKPGNSGVARWGGKKRDPVRHRRGGTGRRRKKKGESGNPLCVQGGFGYLLIRRRKTRRNVDTIDGFPDKTKGDTEFAKKEPRLMPSGNKGHGLLLGSICLYREGGSLAPVSDREGASLGWGGGGAGRSTILGGPAPLA